MNGWGCAAPVESDLCERYRCDPSPREFAPTPQAEGATRQALSRLNKATCLDLRVEGNGLPVVMSQSLYDPENCAETLQAKSSALTAPQGIAVDQHDREECPSDPALVLHELIHALVRSDHSTTGAFAPNGGNGMLDRATLESLCTGLPEGQCPCFNTEGQ